MMLRPNRSLPRAMAAMIAVPLVATVAAGFGSSSNASASAAEAPGTSAPDLAPIHGTYSPKIGPADFVATVDNRYFPLEPGTTFPTGASPRMARPHRPTTWS